MDKFAVPAHGVDFGPQERDDVVPDCIVGEDHLANGVLDFCRAFLKTGFLGHGVSTKGNTLVEEFLGLPGNGETGFGFLGRDIILVLHSL